MSLWPDSVKLAGASIALADVDADVAIHHGRESINDEPTSTTCQLTFRDVDHAFVRAFDVGQSLALTARDGTAAPIPRFTGSITDAKLDDDELTVIAVGLLATSSPLPVGAVDWPEEAWSARVTRVFTEAGIGGALELHADPSFDPILAARETDTAGPTTLGDYLAFLAPMVGALVADRMNGNVLVQAIGARRLDGAITIDPADVAYAPEWIEELPGGNIVTVRYQADQGASVTVQDDVSIGRYRKRPVTIDTSFRDVADATYRANQRLSRSAYTHWTMVGAPILRGLPLELGAPVVLSGMPAAAPFDPWTPVVEGWSETIAGDAWTMALALSDPLASGVTLPWSAIPHTAAYLWNAIDPATDWTEALTLEDLEPA